MRLMVLSVFGFFAPSTRRYNSSARSNCLRASGYSPRSLYVCPMVSRTAASTSGCRSNFPVIRCAARSKTVRTFRSGSGLAPGRDWLAALACPNRSFCRKSLTAWATAASRFARMLCRMLIPVARMSTNRKAAAVTKAARLRRANLQAR